MADIPGLIEGAHEGAGLGIRFLKHLQRTRVLVHLVDVAPLDGSSPVEGTQSVINELALYDEELLDKPRILVLSQIDKLPEAERDICCQQLIDELEWTGPVVKISALQREGLQDLIYLISATLVENMGMGHHVPFEQQSEMSI